MFRVAGKMTGTRSPTPTLWIASDFLSPAILVRPCTSPQRGREREGAMVSQGAPLAKSVSSVRLRGEFAPIRSLQLLAVGNAVNDAGVIVGYEQGAVGHDEDVDRPTRGLAAA